LGLITDKSNNLWCAPKSLIGPKLGLSYSSYGIVGDSGHVPSSQH
jgi:hypothetical protein